MRERTSPVAPAHGDPGAVAGKAVRDRQQGSSSPFARVRRWWAKTWDGRVLAPRAYIIMGTAYVPQSWLDAVKPELAPATSELPATFGMPVRPLPAYLDQKHREDEWRRNSNRFSMERA